MKGSDKALGLNKAITRRDFLGGVGLAVSGSMLPSSLIGSPLVAGESLNPRYYPPALTGMRGSHPGSFEVAHALGRHGIRDFGIVYEDDAREYDLVVVGAGLSGLSAAHFYQKKNPNASILILDNHDDFGGHAKRNEFQINGKTLIGHGGSQTITNPALFPREAKRLLKDLGIKTSKFNKAYDKELYKNLGMGRAVYFDKDTYGEDKVVPVNLGDREYLNGLEGRKVLEAIPEMPISAAAKAELTFLYGETKDQIKHKNIFTEGPYLVETSYKEFLIKDMGIKEPETFTFLESIPGDDAGYGLDNLPAIYGFFLGLPGFKATSLGNFSWFIDKATNLVLQDYIHHFPDGNASVARMLVRKMIPEVAPGTTMEDIVEAPFDYSKLDNKNSPVRLRLNSTVVNVEHMGKASEADKVAINYVNAGKTSRVIGKNCILACYNQIIPHLCPSLPEQQKQALNKMVKTPLIYSNVLLKDWRAFADAKIASAHCPGSYHHFAMLDFPVSMADYQFSSGPDEPILLHMQRVPIGEGENRFEQNKNGRLEIFQTPFEKIERETRKHLAGMLSGTDFDPARDIQGLTVNRWPHGYSPTFFDYEGDEAPNVTGRKTFGRIAIANSDAGANAMLEEAVVQAHRAVDEIT